MRGLTLAAVVIVLALVFDTLAQESEDRKRTIPMPSYYSFSEIRPFRGRERAGIVVYGETTGVLLGVYVFDSNGSCVALDDGGDDVAVEWYSPRRQRYSYEVRNLGMNQTKLEIAIW